MMNDEPSFDQVLETLRTRNRDPRSIRLAAVTLAIVEVVEDASPAQVYASTVTALEGTLQQQQEGSLADSLSTQVALLELLKATTPYVSPAAVGATLSVTSRVLRAVVSSCQSVQQQQEHETKDELGGINATLRGACRASTEILRQVPNNAPEKTVKQFFHYTLLTLFQDRRPKVRKAAQNGAMELVMMTKSGNTCHVAFLQSLTSFAHHCLDRARKHEIKSSSDAANLLHLLTFLEGSILYLDANKLGKDIMELLVNLVRVETTADAGALDYVASFRKDATNKVLMVNGLLSVLVTMLDEEGAEGSSVHLDDVLPSRVLASLLQAKPLFVFSQVADADMMIAGKALYGRAVLMVCSRVLSMDPSIGLKLLPLSIQKSLQLCRPREDEEAGSSEGVASGIMAELTKVLRLQLTPMIQQKDHSKQIDQCLQDCLGGLEQVLQHAFRDTWAFTLQPLVYIMQLTTLTSHQEELSELVESLIKLCIHVSEDGPSRQAVEEAIGSFIQGVGLEQVWAWISWTDAKSASARRPKMFDAVIDGNRSWLLQILKTSSMAVQTNQLHLAFFQKEVLGLARQCDAVAAMHKDAFHRARVTDLWSLFPCFCVNPADVEEALPNLAGVLVRAMGDARYPQLVPIICGGLKILASGVSERQSMEGALRETEVVSELSTKLLPALFKLVETLQGTAGGKPSSKDDMDVEKDNETQSSRKNATSQEAQRTQSVTEAIVELARLAPQPYLQSLFKKVMQRLLAAIQTEENEAGRFCTLLGLSQALVSSEALSEESISLLYRAVTSLTRTDEYEPRVQKRAYKVLLEICNHYNQFVMEEDRLKELTDGLVESIMTCQVPARFMRLKCMSLIVEGFDSEAKQHMDIIPKVVGEVLLCLKDSNGKTREAGYQLLIAMASTRDDKTAYFQTVAAALGAQTPHMRSAAVMALSRLVFEFARVDFTVQALLPPLLQTVLVLFDENSREVTKSVVGFVRVSVAAMSPEQLEPILSEVVGGLLKYGKGKDRFRAKIKIILKKLVRLYGYDKLMPLVPEGDARLLTHMRKLSERAERRKAALKQDEKPENNGFDEMMESDEDDSDDGRTLMTGATGFTRLTARSGKTIRSAAMERSEKRSVAGSTIATNRSRSQDSSGPRICNETDGEVMDMLDPRMAKSVRFAEEVDNDSDSDGGAMEFDELGRLIVHDDLEETSVNVDLEKVDGGGGKKRKLSKFESAKVARDEKQKSRGKKKQPQALGAAYKSKKAGGDVKKKGQKFEPYAYVPLDGKSYTKKNRRQAVKRMATVVRGGKRKR